MQLIIDIPDEKYERIIKDAQARMYHTNDLFELITILENGTPLPKGHGKIIDVNEAINYIDDYALGFFGFDGVPAIIEADTESEEKYHA